jgi:hypothetical protein
MKVSKPEVLLSVVSQGSTAGIASEYCHKNFPANKENFLFAASYFLQKKVD